MALQILWLNLITDGLPALALGVDPAEPNVMKRKPRHSKESIVKRILMFAIVSGVMNFIILMTVFVTELDKGIIHARTMAFTTSVIFELILVFSARSNENIFKSKPFANKFLLFAVASSILLQLVTIYNPLFQTIFQTTALTMMNWAKIIMLSGIGVLIIDSTKSIHARSR
ncbi:MAG: hypothetical protein GON13_00585 [Nanoarchaeota archaeon]|nr:hypothetical protein [Nanoarchaeota archaeon]